MSPLRDVRADFPLLSRRLVYLDSAATSQKPRAVIDAVSRFYEETNANVHRGVYRLAEEADAVLSSAREAVRRFIGAVDAGEIVFTHGTTESINLVAQGWAAPRLRPGDEIAVSALEHHSNFLPWQRVARTTGASLRIVPLDDTARPERWLSPRTRLVALSHVSNALGIALPAAEIARAARARGAAVLIDAAQSVPHVPLDVGALGADFVAFSGHKMLGPMGIGVLWGRRERLAETEPLLLGGGMVREVRDDSATFLDAPAKLEAGTPPVAEAAGLRAAIEYLEQLGMDAVREHARELISHAVKRLANIPSVTVYAPDANHVSAVSFNVEGAHPHDVAAFLDQRGICVRAGHHCAQPLMRALGVNGTVRASVQVYSTRADVEALAAAVDAARSAL